MSLVNINPPQTFSRLFRPWEFGNYDIDDERPSKPIEVESLAKYSDTDSFNGNIQVEPSSTSFSGNESDRECTSSSSSTSSKSFSFEESFNNSSNDQATSNANATTTITNYGSAVEVPYTNRYLYGSMEAAAPAAHFPARFATHFPPTVNSANMPSYMLPTLPSSTNFYYAAAAAAAAAAVANNDIPSTSSAAYALNPYGFNFMDREYARVMVEDAQLKAANARKQRPKKFKCTMCDVAFSNNGQLKGHIRIHTGERPFKCDYETCDKTFTRNEELTRHKRIHTGLKPYPCPICGKCFGRRDHLSKHLKTHLPKTSATMYLSMYPDFFGL